MASSRRRGLAPSALADAGEELSVTRQLIGETLTSGTVIQDLPIEDVSPHPGNRPSGLELDDEFVDSIRERGVETPGKVIPVAIYERAGGKVEDLPNPDAKYVIIFGARRWAGARQAGLATYPAVVHDQEISARDIRIRRIMENIHRRNLTEIDEALDYQALLEDLGSQRAVAAAVKKSQPHVHRRLKLLELPTPFQQALRDRAITGEIANELARFPEQAAQETLAELLALAKDDLEPEARVAARRQIMDRARQEIDRAQRIDDARSRAATAGIPLVDDPAARFGDAAPDHRVEGRQQLEAARAAGTLLAHVTGNGDTHYYLAALPVPAADTAGITSASTADPSLAVVSAGAPTDTAGITPTQSASAQPNADGHGDTAGITPTPTTTVRPPAQRRDGDDAERRAASHARSAACRRLVTKSPPRDQVVSRLVNRIIDGDQQGHGAAATMACQWLRANGVGPTDLDGLEYLKHVSITDDAKLRTHFAYALDLALDEVRTSRSRDWDSRDAAHVHRLEQDAGYEPTPWELTQILAATPAAATVGE